ncbi:MAG TPA: hypothetical protein VL200_07445 [Lacunisphaera sp.]|jgi:hypothetical protein|nr:hypothetical protein [Lacunisphaera sp.]
MIFLLALVAGCAKPPDLSQTLVKAGSADELAAFRADLGNRFTADQLKDFDTATKELQLDAMSHGIKAAADRETAMLRAIDGRTVGQALVAGWQARHRRLEGETKQISELLASDLKARDQAVAKGRSPSSAVETHIQNEQEILARLNRDLAATDQQLAAWGARPSH